MDERLQAEICARIKLGRKEAGMTLEDMADALGVTQRAYWNYEHNRVPFRLMTEIAKITGKTQDWLYRGAELPAAPKDELLQGVADGVAEIERASEDVLQRLDEVVVRLGRIEGALLPPGDAQQTHS